MEATMNTLEGGTLTLTDTGNGMRFQVIPKYNYVPTIITVTVSKKELMKAFRTLAKTVKK